MSPMCSFRSTFNPCQNVRRGKNRPWHPPCTELPSQVNLYLWPMSKFWPRLRQTLAQTTGTITSTYAAKWFFPAQDPAVSIKIKRPRAKFNQKPRCLCRRPRVRRTCVVCLLSVARKRGKRGPTEPEYSGVGEILHAHFRHNTNVPSHFDPDFRPRSLQHLYEYGQGLLSQWAPAEMPSVPWAPGTALEPDPVGESASSMGTQIMQALHLARESCHVIRTSYHASVVVLISPRGGHALSSGSQLPWPTEKHRDKHQSRKHQNMASQPNGKGGRRVSCLRQTPMHCSYTCCLLSHQSARLR